MSEYDYEDEEQSETETRNPVRARMKELEKQLAEAERRAQQAETAARKASFLEAGLDLNNKMTQYFVKAYDGELTPEAIKQAAVEANLISTPNNGEEAAAWKRTEQVANGSGTAQPPIDWTKRINEATSQAEVEAILAEAREYL
jgi:hypothetical protein